MEFGKQKYKTTEKGEALMKRKKDRIVKVTLSAVLVVALLTGMFSAIRGGKDIGKTIYASTGNQWNPTVDTTDKGEVRLQAAVVLKLLTAAIPEKSLQLNSQKTWMLLRLFP